jgi:ribose 5-phosphate isomerase A
MNQDTLKQQAAEAALAFINPGDVVGVGTGSTIAFFIKALAKMKGRIDGAVASSLATRDQLKSFGIPVLDLNATGDIPLYVDGADEINPQKQMIKGGGGALTGEKIIASAAKQFICIVDESKCVDLLGQFPVAIEVIPMARSYVGRQLFKLGANPEYRHDFVSDHGNFILDTYQLDLSNALAMEMSLNNITGVVCNGLFAKRTADLMLVAGGNGVCQR